MKNCRRFSKIHDTEKGESEMDPPLTVICRLAGEFQSVNFMRPL